MSSEETPKRGGFASLTPERRREIARIGGQAAHASGRAHKFSPEEAQRAGRKGGNAPHRIRGRPAKPKP